MQYEVEQKFPVDDHAELEAKLTAMGARFAEPIIQIDRYFAHPARDFASTDEALRIRQVGTECRVTYKGPKLDAVTKTRQELELPLGDGPDVASRWTTLLGALSFQPVMEVSKCRRTGRLVYRDATVEIALDQIDGLGCFVELELAVDAEEFEQARSRILSLADELGLADPERRSYLELVMLAADSPNGLS
jgi:adenylate cyclase class 2